MVVIDHGFHDNGVYSINVSVWGVSLWVNVVEMHGEYKRNWDAGSVDSWILEAIIHKGIPRWKSGVFFASRTLA